MATASKRAKGKTSSATHDIEQMANSSKAEKMKMLESTVARIEKDCGKGAIMRLGGDAVEQVEAISTGSLSLDKCLGVGGLPRGRVVEIYGPESSGKTTLALHAIAQAQKEGGIAALIDAEHAFDPGYAKKIGVDLETLLVSQPDSGEQALQIAEKLTASGAVDVIVVDSVAALVPKAELEGDIGDSHVGLQARLMSHALRKLTGIANKGKTALIFINQLREKIGVMFGSPETTPGGRALKFYASVRLDVRRVGSIKDGEAVIGNRTRVTVSKNKVAPPFAKAEFDIVFAQGIDTIGEILDLGQQHGVIKAHGSWFSFGDTRLGQGRNNVRAFLLDPANADIFNEIHELLMAKLYPEDGSATPPPSGDPDGEPSGDDDTDIDGDDNGDDLDDVFETNGKKRKSA